jgi:hypothetical protein
MNDKIKTAIDFVSRHAVWFITGLLAAIFMRPGLAEIHTILFIALFEAAAIALSGLALYAYTKINFTKVLLKGDDDKFTDLERQGMYDVIGKVFMSVHMLVGLIVLGVYIAQFSN